MYEFKLREGLQDYMKEEGYTSMRDAAYDALENYYLSAGFPIEAIEDDFGSLEGDRLFEAFDIIFDFD